jgi:adenylate cyclase
MGGLGLRDVGAASWSHYRGGANKRGGDRARERRGRRLRPDRIDPPGQTWWHRVMGTEIERKFLVKGTAWREGVHGQRFRQGYLSVDRERTVRVRAVGGRAWLTVKGLTTGFSRLEFEYEIPAADATTLLDELCLQPIIDKTRYEVRHCGRLWEVDEFHGVNEGLVIAEIELDSEQDAFERPPWLGDEVSDDPRYFNARLVRHPFRDW